MRVTPGFAWARPALMSMTAAESATDRPAWRSSRLDSVAAWCLGYPVQAPGNHRI